MRNRLVGALALALTICAPHAGAQTSYAIKDANGARLNMKAFTISGLISPANVIVDPVTGVPANVTAAGAQKTDSSATTQPVSIVGTPTFNCGTGCSGGGGGSNAAAGTTGSAVPASASYTAGIFSGNLKGWTFDTNGYGDVNVMDGVSVTNGGVFAIQCTSGCSGTNPSVGTTGIAVPSSAGYVGLNFGGNLKGWVGDTNGYGDVNVMDTVAVTGTFWQTTQPVSIAGTVNVDCTTGCSGGGGSNAAASATGSAVPSSASYTGVNFGGNLKGWVGDTNGYGDVNIENTPAVTQSGTWTIQPGNTANSTPWLTTDSASVAQASTTSGQKGGLVQGAVTTSAPSYTTAQTSPISLDVSGNTRVVDNTLAGVIGSDALSPLQLQVAGTQAVGDSGVKANATATATLSAISGHTQYLTEAYCTASGATTASVANGTITGLLGGTINFIFVFPAGVTLQATTFKLEPKMPMPASTTNTAISVSLPASGSGGTDAQCTIGGFYI